MFRPIDVAYMISLPDIGTDPFSFSYNVKTPSGNFNLRYRWNTENLTWAVFITMPDGSVRQSGIFPNNVNWTAYPDFGFATLSDQASIGQNDLLNVQHYIIVWGAS